VTDLPLTRGFETASVHEALSAGPLLDTRAARAITPTTAALDKGYEAVTVYNACRERREVANHPAARNQLGRSSRARRSATAICNGAAPLLSVSSAG
jgi:hypothetical protein